MSIVVACLRNKLFSFLATNQHLEKSNAIPSVAQFLRRSATVSAEGATEPSAEGRSRLPVQERGSKQMTTPSGTPTRATAPDRRHQQKNSQTASLLPSNNGGPSSARKTPAQTTKSTGGLIDHPLAALHEDPTGIPQPCPLTLVSRPRSSSSATAATFEWDTPLNGGGFTARPRLRKRAATIFTFAGEDNPLTDSSLAGAAASSLADNAGADTVRVKLRCPSAAVLKYLSPAASRTWNRIPSWSVLQSMNASHHMLT